MPLFISVSFVPRIKKGLSALGSAGAQLYTEAFFGKGTKDKDQDKRMRNIDGRLKACLVFKRVLCVSKRKRKGTLDGPVLGSGPKAKGSYVSQRDE